MWILCLAMRHGKYVFKEKVELDNGMTIYYYYGGPYKAGCLIRRCGEVALQVDVQADVSGKDKVSATTLAGNVVHTQLYDYDEECRMCKFQYECHEKMVMQNRATRLTKVKMVQDDKILRGNCVLKKFGGVGRKKEKSTGSLRTSG